MEVRVIGFAPPIVGVEKSFNTFRIGSFYTKNLKEGEEVLLLNEKEKMIFGRARVSKIDDGKLRELCLIHAHMNHSHLHVDPSQAPAMLFKKLQRLYGPHIAEPNKRATVVYLERIE